MSRPLRKSALLGSCAAQACGASHALEWRSTPAVTVGAGEDSNIWLDPYGDRRASTSSMSASADVLASGPGIKLHVQPEVRALRYANGADADRNDAFTNAEFTLTRERDTLTVGSGYRRESTLTSEFIDTGVLGLEDERTERSMTAGWNHVVGPRSRVSLAASTVAVNYGSAGAFSPFVDYDYRVVQLGYQISTTARSAWVFSATRSNLDGAITDTTNTAFQARWVRSFSPTLHGELGLGTFDVRTANRLGAQQDSGAALSFSVTREWAHWSLQSGGGRDLRPDGRGALVREDAVTLDALRRFGPRLSVGLSVRRARIAATEELANVYDRDYSQTGVALEWRMKERWQLRASLQERMQQLPYAPRGSGIGAQVSMTYRGR
jgi:hypothetical protein